MVKYGESIPGTMSVSSPQLLGRKEVIVGLIHGPLLIFFYIPRGTRRGLAQIG